MTLELRRKTFASLSFTSLGLCFVLAHSIVSSIVLALSLVSCSLAFPSFESTHVHRHRDVVRTCHRFFRQDTRKVVLEPARQDVFNEGSQFLTVRPNRRVGVEALLATLED